MSRLCIVSLVAVCLIGCGGSDYKAPVERRFSKPAPMPYSYVVRRGDTLYSIAFRYGLDYRSLAAANNISTAYTIYPGQKLRLAKPAPSQQVAAAPVAKSTATPIAKPLAKPRPKPPLKTASKPAVLPRPKAIPKAIPNTTVQPQVSAPTNAKVSSWRWPTAGKVIRGYSSSVHKGIDIAGKKGDPIFAVAPGQVVYAGTGIVGFGELLIIKHNELYLSAYGHNSRLLVDEGETVRAGQKIAEKGSSGTDSTKLHFEIRKEGKPIDPRRLLP